MIGLSGFRALLLREGKKHISQRENHLSVVGSLVDDGPAI